MRLPPLLQALTFPDTDWRQAFIDAGADGDERPTWAYDWPAGLRLASVLGDIIQPSGQRICDLGCGRGTLGLCALQLGALSVRFCDGSPQVLAYVDTLLTANALTARGHTHAHTWGADLPHAPYDIIIGGDILYRPECFHDLFSSIASALSPHGYAILSDPRDTLETQLPRIAADCGLSVHEQRHCYPTGDFTTIRLQRLVHEP